jgi:hypothetical protein
LFFGLDGAGHAYEKRQSGEQDRSTGQ